MRDISQPDSFKTPVASPVQADRVSWLRFGEPAVLIALVVVAILTAIILRRSPDTALLTPLMVTSLLVANLLPAMALLMLAGRRFARRRAGPASGGEARLHTRLVVLFSVTAAAPTLLVAIFASFLFQSGMDFWFSERSRGMFENAVSVAQNYFENEKGDVGANALAMATDLRGEMARNPMDSDRFLDFYVQQVVVRELSESAIIEIGADGVSRTVALIDPDNRAAENRLPAATIQRLLAGEEKVTGDTADGVDAVVRLTTDRPIFLYAARGSTLLGINSVATARSIFADYNALFTRSQSLQFRFALALYLGSLLLVGMAVWAALLIADRIVTPIDELVTASSRVAAGDLEVRVRSTAGRTDEIAHLASAFNRMTERLGEQTRDLLTANDQIESRRAFIEAVLSAVGSGVLSVGDDGIVRLVNAAATRMLRRDEPDILGAPLAIVAPELRKWLDDGMHDPVLTLDLSGESRIWTLKAIAGAHGHVLTFEDITQQLYDQRRAAWSDVARRIAHEIKNPLTPIQLAAERLQRRFGDAVGDGQDTFRKLTSTIIRQVGDLRRMVDEFSNFARMPKPLFREESLIDIVRQTVFLHEVAHPDIRFTTQLPDGPALLTCDRRLIAQALTNIVKNGVEAIQRAGREPGEANGQISVAITSDARDMHLSITDNGVGLPAERDQIAEPYVTAREGGTGLGLAIVKKIIEEHGGTLSFDDAADGGTAVYIVLPIHPPAAAGQSTDIERV